MGPGCGPAPTITITRKKQKCKGGYYENIDCICNYFCHRARDPVGNF
nr:MAG TPA: hypothetical protein [Caudoviricetes sp.]